MPSQDPRARFTETVDAYRRHRPDYPTALVDGILEQAGLGPEHAIVDVGCGTGIASRLFAARGLRVIGVDPNEAMLASARAGGGAVEVLRGEAEALPLPDQSMHGAISAQAFHWFDRDRTVRELGRVLRPEGCCAAFWNLRDSSDPFTAAYREVLRTWSPEYGSTPSEGPVLGRLRECPLLEVVGELAVPHAQALDRERLSGRAWSSSYVAHGVHDRAGFEAALDDLFREHARSGVVVLRYRSCALLFRPTR